MKFVIEKFLLNRSNFSVARKVAFCFFVIVFRTKDDTPENVPLWYRKVSGRVINSNRYSKPFKSRNLSWKILLNFWFLSKIWVWLKKGLWLMILIFSALKSLVIATKLRIPCFRKYSENSMNFTVDSGELGRKMYFDEISQNVEFRGTWSDSCLEISIFDFLLKTLLENSYQLMIRNDDSKWCGSQRLVNFRETIENLQRIFRGNEFHEI